MVEYAGYQMHGLVEAVVESTSIRVPPQKYKKIQNKARSAHVGPELDHKHQVPGGMEVAGLAGGGGGWGR